MKVLAVAVALACLTVALAAPEAPRYRAPARNSAPPPPAPADDYGAPSTDYGAPNAPSTDYGAPYPPSGWRPSGRQFQLPQRQTSYYAPPADEYGPPPPPPATDAPTTQEPTEQEPTTTEQPQEGEGDGDGEGESSEGARAVATAAAGGDRDGAPAGVYYVLLPDGRLQRVAYSTNPAVPPPAAAPVRNAGFAQLQYMDVEPVRAPVYSYGAPLLRVA